MATGNRPALRNGQTAYKGVTMERDVRQLMWLLLTIGFVFAAAVGLAAGDRGMITGALAGYVGGLIATPFMARMWR